MPVVQCGVKSLNNILVPKKINAVSFSGQGITLMHWENLASNE